MSENNSSQVLPETINNKLVPISLFLNKINKIPWLAEGIAVIGCALYLGLSFYFAHTQDSVLDEGAYLYKGWLFATGKYAPFQEYGVWTNQMPLSFLIPGYAQVIFEPGIRTGRYLSIFLGILILVGLWVLVRRLAGRWYATAVVLLFAWNPAMSRMYSIAVPQVLVAAMFTWVLVLTLGKDRPPWQIITGSFLAGLMVMTRLNMAPVPILLFIYILWQHGWKLGIVSALTMGATIVVGHAIYWPGILRIWTNWLPRSLTPFLNPWRLPGGYQNLWDPAISLEERLTSLFRSFRFHFIAIAGSLGALFLWSTREKWKNATLWRISVFLLTSFIVLLLFHMWAALGKEYCVFCLEGYLAFFSMLGLILLVISFPAWNRKLPRWRQWVIAIVILISITGILFSAYEEISVPLYEIPIPRFLTGTFESGSIFLGAILENKFQLERLQVLRILPPVAGIAIGLSFLFLVYILSRHRVLRQFASYGYWMVIAFLLVGIILTPTLILGGGYERSDCRFDTIGSFEEAGKHLAKYIPPGSSVYWRGGLSIVPLLYVPGIETYPPQINDGYSYLKEKEGEDSQMLLKLGFWNGQLAEQWAREADFILIEKRSYSSWIKDYVNSGYFEELPATPPTVLCREDYAIRIFRRVK